MPKGVQPPAHSSARLFEFKAISGNIRLPHHITRDPLESGVKEYVTVSSIQATPEIVKSVGDRQPEIDGFFAALKSHMERIQSSQATYATASE